METLTAIPHGQQPSIRKRFHGSVIVEEFSVNWDDPGQSTLERVISLNEEDEERCLYLNPQYTVTCQRPTAEFFRRARKCQAAWFRRLGKVLGSANLRRASKRADVEERQLTYTGFMFVYGELMAPHDWSRNNRPSLRTKPATKSKKSGQPPPRRTDKSNK